MNSSTCQSTSSGGLGTISSPSVSSAGESKLFSLNFTKESSSSHSPSEALPTDSAGKSTCTPNDSENAPSEVKKPIVGVKAPKAEAEAGALSLSDSSSKSSSSLSLPDVPVSPSDALDVPETPDIDMEESTSSSDTSSLETDSTASLEICCCEMSCNRNKWDTLKRICSSVNPLRSEYIPRCKLRKRLLFTLGSLCTGMDPVSQSDIAHSPSCPFNPSDLSPSPVCDHEPDIKSHSTAANHSMCQSSYLHGHSVNYCHTPEESEPMLKNESQVPSIESTGQQSARESDIRHPVTRSPGRIFSLTNPNTSVSGSGVGKKVTPLNVLANSDDQSTRQSALRNHSVNSNNPRAQSQSLPHQQSPLTPLETSVHHSPHQLCQVCIPLRSITTTSVPSGGQVACYVCHSPSVGHPTLDREGTSGHRQMLGSMAAVNASPGPNLVPKSSNMPLDMNIYATRKTIAQGMLDICLMISNATQLKYILLHAPRHKYVEATIALITLSILLQIIIGIVLIFQGRWNINYRGDQRKADIANNIVVILIFLVTVVNVMASAFGPSELPSSTHSSNSASTTATIAFLPSSSTPNSP